MTGTNPLERVAPYAVRDGVLPPDELAALIDFTLASEASFEPTQIVTKGSGTIDRGYRASLSLPRKLLEPWRGRIKAAVTPLLPGVLQDLGVQPFEVAHYEIELVRHNDGDFYRRHIDLIKDAGGIGRRAVSMVYYFHAEPKAFEGGALRLYSVARNDVFADVEPAQNRLVAFASWIPHEVMPIACASGRFVDSRFAINCWARIAVPGQQPGPGQGQS